MTLLSDCFFLEAYWPPIHFLEIHKHHEIARYITLVPTVYTDLTCGAVHVPHITHRPSDIRSGHLVSKLQERDNQSVNTREYLVFFEDHSRNSGAFTHFCVRLDPKNISFLNFKQFTGTLYWNDRHHNHFITIIIVCLRVSGFEMIDSTAIQKKPQLLSKTSRTYLYGMTTYAE